MPWSNPEPNRRSTAASVLKKDVAETKVLKHEPIEFSAESAHVIETYQKAQSAGSDFRMSDVVKNQTGIKKVEEENLEGLVQERLLEKLAEVQEGAYQEAYQLGLEEGTQKAFQEMRQRIDAGLSDFQGLINHIQQMRIELFNANEKHLVELAFHMAKLLAQKEISTDQAHIVEVMKNAVQMAQNEDDVRVHISAENYHFVQALFQQKNQNLDFLEKMKIISEDSFQAGDCIVRTNYGEVDSRLETRAQTLWKELNQVVPHPAVDSKVETIQSSEAVSGETKPANDDSDSKS